MSMSIDVRLKEAISAEEVYKILDGSVRWLSKKVEPMRMFGRIEGAGISITFPRGRRQDLCDELYGVAPLVSVGFQPEKFIAYEMAYGGIVESIVALVKLTKGDMVASEGDLAFLRRLDGYITLYNQGGMFDAEVRPQWRPKFDFPHDFQERFER